MKKTKVTQKDIFFVSISMFIIVVLWIGFNLYHAWATSTISEDLQIQIVPIGAKFDTQTLDTLKSREKIEPLSDSIPQATATPTPTEDFLTDSEPSEELLIPEEEPLSTEEIFPTEEPIPTL